MASTAIGVAGAGAGLLVGCGDDDDRELDFDGELEVTSLRIAKPPPACQAAQYVAERYLREEGFTDIEYVQLDLLDEISLSTATGVVDFAMDFSPYTLAYIDRAADLKILAGIHVGCWEVFAIDPEIRSIQDLRGKTIGAEDSALNGRSTFMASFLGYVGIDVDRDVNWKPVPFLALPDALLAGEIDAFATFPPMTNDMRARGIGHVILDGVRDSPYSGFFCCMLDGNAEFIEQSPVATRRVLRSYIRAAEHCAREPEAVADFLVAEGGFPNLKPEYAREMMAYLPYDVWRRFDPEDTVRFYALRLHEAGIIRSTPEEIIARGTDWRFLQEMKEEFARLRGSAGRNLSFYCDPASSPPAPSGRTVAAPRPPRSGWDGRRRA
jgi:NitT/TauT family transport system substrate-binding protein